MDSGDLLVQAIVPSLVDLEKHFWTGYIRNKIYSRVLSWKEVQGRNMLVTISSSWIRGQDVFPKQRGVLGFPLKEGYRADIFDLGRSILRLAIFVLGFPDHPRIRSRTGGGTPEVQ
jgi:hypothetical protein